MPPLTFSALTGLLLAAGRHLGF